MGLFVLLVGFIIVGIVLVVFIVGLLFFLLIGVIVGGVNVLSEIVSKEVVLDGCDVKKWFMFI